MNMFGLPMGFLKELEKGFPEFLGNVKERDVKAEYLLPAMIDQCIRTGKARVRVLETRDKWFGVTYKEDKPAWPRSAGWWMKAFTRRSCFKY